MNSILKFKLITHLATKKNEKGFTLIELLVVVIIIAILATIALPNLLGTVANARNAEGRGGVATLNLAQQEYRSENTTFGNRSDLGRKIQDGQFFTFTSDIAEFT